MGVSYETYDTHSGITVLFGKKEGKTIAIRADMDGLALTEDTGLPYSSVNSNMHACGHDSHTAVLLGVAQILKEHESELTGQVKLLFQPAEEGPGGAYPMILDGVLENPKVDAVLALHGGMYNDIPVGHIGVCKKGVFAADDQVIIEIQGIGGHGSTPHTCVDPVLISSMIVNNIQSIISREISAYDQSVVTIASIEAGRGTYNIIPSTAMLKGTIRHVDPTVRDYVLQRIEEIAIKTAEMMRGCCTVTYLDSYPAVVNDPDMIEYVLSAAKQVLPEGAVHMLDRGNLGGEDAGFFFERVPGCYFFMSNSAPCLHDGIIYGPHHPRFDIDDSVLYLGTAVFLTTVTDWLNE